MNKYRGVALDKMMLNSLLESTKSGYMDKGGKMLYMMLELQHVEHAW